MNSSSDTIHIYKNVNGSKRLLCLLGALCFRFNLNIWYQFYNRLQHIWIYTFLSKPEVYLFHHAYFMKI